MARTDKEKRESYKYLVCKGAELRDAWSLDLFIKNSSELDKTIFAATCRLLQDIVELCCNINKLRREYVKQINNISAGHGSVNGKWYQGPEAVNVFRAKLERTKKSMKNLLKRKGFTDPSDVLFFKEDGNVFFNTIGIEFDISKF